MGNKAIGEQPDIIVRQAGSADRDAVLHYLEQEAELNTFAIGDIQRFGMETEFQQVFVAEKTSAQIGGVVLRYRGNLLPYTHAPEYASTALASVINQYTCDGAKWTMCGTDDVLSAVLPKLIRYPSLQDSHEYFCVCRQLVAEPPPMSSLVEVATPEHAKEITELFVHVPEFQNFSRQEAQLAEEIRDGIAKIVFVRDPETGRMVSTATTAAETHVTGMIIGVATVCDGAFRKKGYASACVYLLVSDLQQRGKSACLFYDNPAAGTIYRRLGFVDFGRWRIMMF